MQEHPQPVPTILFEDQNGNHFSLPDLRGKRVLVEFIYTRCRSICLALGSTFQQIRAGLAEARLKDIVLLSVSFDPRDQRPALAAHAQMYRADRAAWIFARAPNPAELPALLRAFGIVVVRTPNGESSSTTPPYILSMPKDALRAFSTTTVPIKSWRS